MWNIKDREEKREKIRERMKEQKRNRKNKWEKRQKTKTDKDRDLKKINGQTERGREKYSDIQIK